MSITDPIFSIFKTLYPIVKGTIVASTVVSVLLSGLLYFKQTSLIYPRYLPEGARTDVPKPSALGIDDWEEVELRTEDGETLRSFFLRTSRRLDQKVTVLFMHGNAGNISHRLPIARVFSEQMGCNIFLLSYRGYGLSTGKPSERGLIIDAQAALEWILSEESLQGHHIIIYGQSLGGALAVKLVERNQARVSAMILENTFRSMRSLIPSAFPPAKYLARFCHQVWASEEKLPLIKGLPVLFLSGLKDELVPPAHMKALYDCCKTKKVWRELQNGSHNDTVGEPGYFEYIYEFIKKVKDDDIDQLIAQTDTSPAPSLSRSSASTISDTVSSRTRSKASTSSSSDPKASTSSSDHDAIELGH